MKGRFRLPSSTLLFYALIAVMALVSIVTFVSAWSWLNRPFVGFLVYYPPYVGSLGLKEWSGTEAGLKYLDRIVSVDGRPVQTGQDVVDAVSEKKPGTPVRYTVESGGKIREIVVPVVLFGLWDFVQIFLTPFLCGLALCALGVIVVFLKADILTSWVFLVFAFSLGAYLITPFEIMTGYHLVRMHYLVANVYPFAVLHLALIFPDRKRILTRFPAFEYLPYIPAVILIAAWQVYLTVFPELLGSNSMISSLLSYRFLGTVTRMFLFISVLIFVLLVLHSVFKASNAQARQRARMILFGVGVGFLPPVIIMLCAHLLKLRPLYQILPFFVIVFPASVSYSIVRHNLFDADTIIKRTVGYVVVTAVVVGAYVLVSIAFNVFLGQYQVYQSKAFPIIFTLIIILIFNPLRNRIQALVDRIFFRKEYDYGDIIHRIGDAMTSLLDLGQILKQMVKTFMEDMFINTSSVMLLNPATAEYQVYLADGEKSKHVEKVSFKRDEPLMRIIEQERRELTRYDMIEDPRYRAVSQSCASDFDAIHASLIVPLVYRDQLIGLLNLGEKKSGKPYKREDIDLLRTLAQQGAVAIQNARLFQENLEKQRMEEELNIARDLQVSMLPSVCPQVKGFTIAATSIPAREVGGDFYDFIEMGKDRLGLVVGDVTGKSVSGALVMAASRSVFRMLSEEQLTVGEIMIRANGRMRKDIKKGMFVALLYAVLNSNDRVLSFCSAGQTHPMYFSSETGKTNILETKGDNFPLGILEECDYQETQIVLKPGDRIIFYTDGIVEAMNEKEEIFGFDKLLDVLQSRGSISADELLREILNKVKLFAGNAPQHDDLTLIVVGAE